MSSSHPYTCLTCALAFPDARNQRAHYATDLHKYNAKRKLAGLPSVSEESFRAKIQQQAAVEEASQGSSARFHCKPCHKTFASDKAYAAHQNSKRHAQIATTNAKAHSNVYNNTKDLPFPCLFCSQSVATQGDHLQHMHKQHGFFVPDQEYLTDLDGLLAKLSELITHFHVCPVCDLSFRQDDPEAPSQTEADQRKGTLAVQMHMRDKNHCRLPWDSIEERLEWSDFYDYSTSYAQDDEDWEDLDEAMDNGELAQASSDDELEEPSGIRLGDTMYELVLPTGKRIGHRDMQRLYKQNFVPVLERERQEEERAAKGLAIQGPGSSDALVVRTKNGQQMLAANPGQARFANQNQSWKEQAVSNRFKTKIGFRHNNQKHFRDPLLQ